MTPTEFARVNEWLKNNPNVHLEISVFDHDTIPAIVLKLVDPTRPFWGISFRGYGLRSCLLRFERAIQRDDAGLK